MSPQRRGGPLRVLVATALGLTLLLAVGCGDDDDSAGDTGQGGGTRDADTGASGASRQEFVDALIAASDAERMTPEQNACFAQSIVDAVGVERMRAAVSPQEIEDRQETNLVDLGVDVTDEDGQRFYELVNACADLRELLIQEVVGGEGLATGVRPCLDTSISDDLLRRLMVDGYVKSRAELSADTSIQGDIRAAFAACSPTTTTPTG